MISVLYVDDEPGLLEIGKLFLEQNEEFSVDTLTSPLDALEVIKKKKLRCNYIRLPDAQNEWYRIFKRGSK